MRRSFRQFLRSVATVGLAAAALDLAHAADPYSANNGFYPFDAINVLLWNGPFRTSNYDYPGSAPPSAWLAQAPRVPLSVATVPASVAGLKKFVEPAMREMIENPNVWNSIKVGWYEMPWQGEGGDTKNGREAILGAFSG